MKKFVIIISAVLCAFSAFAQRPPQDKNWEEYFKDDFKSFNYNLWYKSHHSVHGEEPQVYDSTETYIDSGKLVLRTQELNNPYQWTNDSGQCPNGSNCRYGGGHYYTSGKIASCKDYKYGYFEICAKLPVSDGYFPAFWLWKDSDTATSNCWYNEIDIFEAEGCKPHVVTGNVHWGFNCPAGKDSTLNAQENPCNYAADYHWYGVEWDRDKITWYIDRKTVRQEVNNMDGIGIQNPLRIIINVALIPTYEGSYWGCQISEENTIFPNYMYVDQVNGYQLICDNKTTVNDLYETVNVANFSGVKKSITLSDRTVIPISGNTPAKANDLGSSLEASLNPQYALRATDFIELKPGFEVRVGANLYLDINPCERKTP